MLGKEFYTQQGTQVLHSVPRFLEIIDRKCCVLSGPPCIVCYTPSTYCLFAALEEVMSLRLEDVVFCDGHVIIAVGSALFVPESDHVTHLVQHGAERPAAEAQGDILNPTLATHPRTTSERSKMIYFFN